VGKEDEPPKGVLENLDLLMNLDLLVNDKKWAALGHIDKEKEKEEDEDPAPPKKEKDHEK
jgi:hypothetical protein